MRERVLLAGWQIRRNEIRESFAVGITRPEGKGTKGARAALGGLAMSVGLAGDASFRENGKATNVRRRDRK